MYINSETDFENTNEEPFDVTKIVWYTVKAKLSESPREQAEKRQAVLKQIEMGILQKNGLPAGITPQMLGIKLKPGQINVPQLLPPLPQKQQPVRPNNNNNSNSNLGYLNKPNQKQQFYSKFGIKV